jgi:Tfp pilus assembly protein PilO
MAFKVHMNRLRIRLTCLSPWHRWAITCSVLGVVYGTWVCLAHFSFDSRAVVLRAEIKNAYHQAALIEQAKQDIALLENSIADMQRQQSLFVSHGYTPDVVHSVMVKLVDYAGAHKLAMHDCVVHEQKKYDKHIAYPITISVKGSLEQLASFYSDTVSLQAVLMTQRISITRSTQGFMDGRFDIDVLEPV